jgi:hypothetical protein
MCTIIIWGDALCLKYEQPTCDFLIVSLKAVMRQPSTFSIKLSLTLCPDQRKIGSAYCHMDWEAAWTREKLRMRLAIGAVSPPIFRLRLATVTKRNFRGLLPHRRGR